MAPRGIAIRHGAMAFLSVAALLVTMATRVQGRPRLHRRLAPCPDPFAPESSAPSSTLEALVRSTPKALPPHELQVQLEKTSRLGCTLLRTMKKELFRSKRLWKFVRRLDVDLDISIYTDTADAEYIQEDTSDIHQTLLAFEEYVSIIIRDEGKRKRKPHVETKEALKIFMNSLRTLRCVTFVASEDADLGDWRVPRELRRVKDGAFRAIRDFTVVKQIVKYVEKQMDGDGSSACNV